MKLPFEEWLERQSIPLPAKGLFEEAIVCYKASAYRAGLLFSFLGLQTILKYRVLEAKQPDYYNPHAWEAILNNLRKQEKWDEEVNECVKKNDGNKKVFNISEDLRHQYKYWKDRRNDCAHSKENSINYSHVEAFWLFIQSNLVKFAVNGSMESLLEKIKRHFDIRYTSPDKDDNYIISDIPHAVNDDSLLEFFEEIHNTFTSIEFVYVPWANSYTVEPFYAFWDKVFNVGGTIAEKLVLFFKSSEMDSVFKEYINHMPQGIVHFRNDPQFIRSFWYEKLVESRVKYKVLSAMLRNNLIPEGEKEEAFERLITNDQGSETIRDEDFYILKEQGFIGKLRNVIFLGENYAFGKLINNFSWAGNNAELVLYYMNKVGLDKEVTESIIHIFSKAQHSWKLRDALKRNFEDKPILKEEFQRLAQEIGVTPPECLGFIKALQQTT